MLTIKQGIKLSAIIDKMEIQLKVTETDEKGNRIRKTQEEVGAELITQMIRKAHKAENEIYAFIAEVKSITVKEAENINLKEFFQEIFNKEVFDFFKSAVT